MYALAASAAGIGVLVLSQPIEAKIVYHKANLVVPIFPQLLGLDLNHDGIVDFRLDVGSFISRHVSGSFVSIYPPVVGNSVQGKNRSPFALKSGAEIGPHNHFSKFAYDMARRRVIFSTHGQHTTTFFGYWANGGNGVKDRFLGLSFMVKGEKHYGWARLNVAPMDGWWNATLTGYAYETVPNRPIIAGNTKGPDDDGMDSPDASLTAPAPQPATLGMLALGAPALSIWRRENLVGAIR
jgi:hypothetical protein